MVNMLKPDLAAAFKGLNLKAALLPQHVHNCCYCGTVGNTADWRIWDQVGVLGDYCEPHAREAWGVLFADD